MSRHKCAVPGCNAQNPSQHTKYKIQKMWKFIFVEVSVFEDVLLLQDLYALRTLQIINKHHKLIFNVTPGY